MNNDRQLIFGKGQAKYRYEVLEGKTPEVTGKQARKLLNNIEPSHVVGLRDRAIIATLIYTAARVGAVSNLVRKDFYETGNQYCLRFLDKGGKSREIPVRYDLQSFIFEYLEQANLLCVDGNEPLFRSAIGKTKRLSTNLSNCCFTGCQGR